MAGPSDEYGDYDLVTSSIVLDDGTGPALYVGGCFEAAGGCAARSLARWDGSTWSPLGSGLTGSLGPLPTTTVHALAVFDDGTGPALYAGGDFTAAGGVPAACIAKWDGSSWSALGTGTDGPVFALAVYDDGTGPALFVGGAFATAGGIPGSNLAKWDGSSWSASGGAINQAVFSLATHDDGSGNALYVGGAFTWAGGMYSPSIVRWNGTTWSSVGGGMDRYVSALTSFDDGSGVRLYAGGLFSHAGGVPANNIARWDGSTWQPLANGSGRPYAKIYSIAVHDDGSGPALYAGGTFSVATQGPGNSIAKWDGAAWTPLGSGLTNANRPPGNPAYVRTLIEFDPGTGPALYAGGRFQDAGGVLAFDIARWQGGAWSALSPGSMDALEGTVEALAVADLGTGPALFAAGSLYIAGTSPVEGIARWDGASWSALGTELAADEIKALEVFDDGTGPALFAGGHNLPIQGTATGHMVKWDGSTWSALGSGVAGFGGDTQVLAAAVYDDGNGPALYVGGKFTEASGIPANSIARWDGSAWSPVGGGTDGLIEALAVYDDGHGPVLVAGGYFSVAGSVPAKSIATWNGSTWASLGSVLGSTSAAVSCLATLERDDRHELYAGGSFSSGGSVDHVARWDGVSWSVVGSGLCEAPRALRVFDDGRGPALYAGGEFMCSGARTLNRIAKWNGTNWNPVGGGVGGSVHALCVFDGGSGVGPSLYAGGTLTTAGAIPSECIAEWRGCATSPGILSCAGDGSSGPCPCFNTGQPGRGCENSAATGGAELTSGGTTTPDAVVLSASGMLPQALTLFIQGRDSIAAIAFGDGLRCAGGALKRLYAKSAMGGSASAPQSPEPSITARSAALGDSLYPGFRRTYQAYYRDPNPSFCPAPSGSTFNTTNALTITWE